MAFSFILDPTLLLGYRCKSDMLQSFERISTEFWKINKMFGLADYLNRLRFSQNSHPSLHPSHTVYSLRVDVENNG